MALTSRDYSSWATEVISVAVMQPYFVPYAGYFRLFAAADVFVSLDTAQFPRRGWVHRNRLLDANSNPRWLTLPLRKAPREVTINELAFADGANDRLASEMRRFPGLRDGTDSPLERVMPVHGESPQDYIERLLSVACSVLGLPCSMVRASSLDIPPDLRGTDRVLAIVRALGGHRYVNLAGGQTLYEPGDFDRCGVALHFLGNYQGNSWSILQRLATESANSITTEIQRSD